MFVQLQNLIKPLKAVLHAMSQWNGQMYKRGVFIQLVHHLLLLLLHNLLNLVLHLLLQILFDVDQTLSMMMWVIVVFVLYNFHLAQEMSVFHVTYLNIGIMILKYAIIVLHINSLVLWLEIVNIVHFINLFWWIIYVSLVHKVLLLVSIHTLV